MKKVYELIRKGFAIDISVLKMHWSLHGFLMGLLFSLPMGFSSLMAPDNPEMTSNALFVSIIVVGVIYGLLIEIITTVLFKAKW